MKVWVTTAGFEEFGITNSLWLAVNLKGFKPEKVYILANDNEKVRKATETARKIVKEEYKAEVIEITFKDQDFNDYKNKLKEVLEKEKNNEVAIDVTHGRKYMSIFSFNLADKYNVKHVYYAHLKDVAKYGKKPIDEIPITFFKMVDFVEELKK